MYVVCSADLAQTVLTKCVKAEGNIRSDSFQLKLNFGFIQDVQESRKVKKKLSLSAAIHASSTNLLDPKERYITLYMYVCEGMVCIHMLHKYLVIRVELSLSCKSIIIIRRS